MNVGRSEHTDAAPIGHGSRQDRIERYQRSPRDVLRVVTFGVTALVLLALTIWVEDAILGFEEDVIELFAFLDPPVERILHGVVVIFAIGVGLAVLAVPLVLRRYRLFGYLFAANTLAALLMAGAVYLIDRSDPTVLINRIAVRAGLTDDATASVTWFAQTTANFIVLGPFVTRRWRRAGSVVIGLMVLVRLVVSVHLPTEVLLALPVGAASGCAILLLFGRPDRRPTTTAIAAALESIGLPVTTVAAASVDARGSTPYFATLDDGGRLFVKVLGEEERAADLLFRMYRFLRFRDLGDERPFSTLRRAVEHEALVALAARDVGIRTPRLRGAADVGGDAMLLAYDAIAGSSLDGVPDEAVTDELMRSVWTEIALGRRHRIAHRDLRRANVFVDADQTPWIIDFGFAELAADERLLAADVAQMLTSFAVVTGAPRAVAAAVEVLGPEDVAAALPRLQLHALSGATQEAVRAHKGLLSQIRSEVSEACGVTDVDVVPLERIGRKQLLMVAVLVGAVYFLAPQLADLPGIAEQVRDANWAWAPAVVLMSVATYIGASISLAGAVPPRLPFGPVLAAQVGSSFASKLAPAGIGGMALNVRFLQKQGVDRPVAVSAIGLNSIAGLVGHLTLVVVFLVWAGPDAFESFRFPKATALLIGLGVAAGVVVIGLLIPPVRRLVVDRIVPVLRRSLDGTAEVLRAPGKVAMLVGGSVMVTLSYLVAVYLSVLAFGGDVPIATVGAVFLIGSAVAQAAPTPGGLGAMEAALIGGLVAAGLDHTIAVPAVFFYRLATFWLPILPGWICFTWLQRTDRL